MPRQKRNTVLRLSLAMVGLLIVGILGYSILEGWGFLESLYMVIITITTIGFGEVRSLSPAGRLFTILIIFMGLSIAAALFAQLGQFIVESGMTHSYGRRRMTNRINKLRNHYLICGYGRIGSAISRKLHEAGVDFVVIDSNPDHIDEAGGLGYAVLLGDGSRDHVLMEAGIQRASGTILCVGDDAVNVNIALAARELNTEQRIISRGADPSVEYRLVRAGADSVVYPMKLGGEQIARSIIDETTKDQGDQGTSQSMLGYELRVVRNLEGMRSVRTFVEEFQALRPVAIRHADGSMSHNPKPEDSVGDNDAILLLVHQERQNRIVQDVPRMEWTDSLKLEVPRIDRELKRLYKTAADFQVSVQDDLGMETIVKRYEDFAAAAGSHFHRQEILMRENGYPGHEEHQLEHEELSRQISGLNKNERYHFEPEIWSQVDRWLSTHILGADKALAEYLKER
jgi:voltage-gated potassium channel